MVPSSIQLRSLLTSSHIGGHTQIATTCQQEARLLLHKLGCCRALTGCGYGWRMRLVIECSTRYNPASLAGRQPSRPFRFSAVFPPSPVLQEMEYILT